MINQVHTRCLACGNDFDGAGLQCEQCRTGARDSARNTSAPSTEKCIGCGHPPHAAGRCMRTRGREMYSEACDCTAGSRDPKRVTPAELLKKPESEIRLEVKRWFELHGALVWDTEQEMRARITPGLSDLIVCWPGRGVAFVEVKSAVGRQSEAQVGFQEAVESAGGVYVVVRSIEDCEAINFHSVRT